MKIKCHLLLLKEVNFLIWQGLNVGGHMNWDRGPADCQCTNCESCTGVYMYLNRCNTHTGADQYADDVPDTHCISHNLLKPHKYFNGFFYC